MRRVQIWLVAVAFAIGSLVLPHWTDAGAVTRPSALAAAARYARSQGYHIGIAVLDTRTRTSYGSGDDTGMFASESVVKAMIAARLLVQGRMSGSTARRAWKMITQSDDGIATSFYPSVGGDGLINWVKRHYHVPNLGSPPSSPGWWGNTHITPRGLVTFYARVKRDPTVGPWLLNAMHHARKYGSDGTYQFFGLPSATTGAAVKQGWGTDYDDWGRSADFNTTGFVNGDRYAVAILARGPVRYYGATIGGILTHTARVLLPGGQFPDPVPTISHRSYLSGPTAGGQRIQLLGSNFTHVTSVMFGGYAGRSLRVASSHTIYVTSPPHKPMRVPIRVFTNHGHSASAEGYYTYISAPTVTSVDPSTGPTSGGNRGTITGTRFLYLKAITFGSPAGAADSENAAAALTVTVPPGVEGTVVVRVRGFYGLSTTTGQYTYATPTAPANTAPTNTAPTTTTTGPPASTPP